MKIVLSLFTVIFLISLTNLVSAEIRVNEVMPHDNNTYADEWVELYNNGTSDILLLNWIISDGEENKTVNITVNASSYALIIDNTNGNCSFFNISSFNCFELPSIGYYGLSDAGESVILYNISSVISNFSWNTNLHNFGKSWGYNGTSWQNCTPTPGFANNCTTIIQQVPSCVQNWSCGSWSTCSSSTQTRTCSDTNNCNNNTGKPVISQSCTTSSSMDLNMDWNEEDIINGEEFFITLTADNLENDDYAVKVWIENDDGDIISERYGNYSDKGDVWVSGRYYVYNFFEGPGDESDDVKLRINEDYANFSEDATIFFSIKNGEDKEISEDITVLEREIDETSNDDSPAPEDLILATMQSGGGLLPGSSVITLTPKANLTTEKENSIIYKSKTEYIREYAPYAFSLICIFIMVLLLIDKKK